jgi:protein-S-isoprenylcysteine O-methyltransferase Ste14
MYIIFLTGLILRVFCILQLKNKNYWRIIPPQRLITTGVYKYIRHPMYSGGLLMSLGLFGILTEWKITICLFYLLVNFTIDRIDKEEQMMLMVFGDKYIEYMKKTKMLIPFIF